MPVAMMNCIPVPADSAPGSYNTDAERIAARLTDRTSAILVAHIAGVPVNMPPIMKLASERGIPVVEDAAQAHGATCQGKPVGTFGEVASFSTMFGKHIATGGQGGVVFTKSEDRYWKVRRFADRGKPLNLPDAGGCVVASLNCNMDELHAAIGRVQLKKLPAVVAQRRAIALKIQEKCAHRLQSVRLVGDPSFGEASFWFLQFKIDSKALSVDKLTFVQALAAEGIPAEPSYLHCPSVWPWFKDRKVFGSSQLPWSHDAERVSDSIVCDLPNVMATDASQFRISLHENWSDNEIDDVVAALAKVENVYRP